MMSGMAMAPEPDAPPAPQSRHAVVTLAVGQKGRDLLAVSGPLMRAAAARWGADFHAITGEDTDFNIGEKLRLYGYLKPYPEGYDRVFYLDADALILPTAPNPFDLFPAGRPYASDDLIGQPQAADWINRENREVCESQGWEWGGPFAQYWNSGVWLVDAEHAPAFAPPEKPYPVYHCSEQHAVNERMRSNGYGVADFGREWNWQWWVESKMAPPPGTHVLHFSGMVPLSGEGGPDAHDRRLALMRQFVPPTPTPGEPLRMVVPALAGKVLNGLPMVAACRHEGAVIAPCLTCGDKDANHVRACGIHGECTRSGRDSARAGCATCPDYGTD